MKKKVLSVLLCGILAVSLLAGCGKQDEGEKDNGKAEEEEVPNDTEEIDDDEQKDQEDGNNPTVFVTPEWVKGVIDGEEEVKNYVILEASWGDEAADYKEAHIPGAVHMNTDNVESDETNWNILPADEIEKVMLDFGITYDTTVIVYSADIAAAGRIAFTCLWLGVEDVKVLDGGFDAWTGAGYETAEGEENPEAVEEFGVSVPQHPEYILEHPEDVLEAQKSDNFRLVSIRTWEEFIGETSGYSYIEGAGEPEGAVWGRAGSDNTSMDDYLNTDGTLKDITEMIPLWEEWDIKEGNEISFYCGTGWRATVPWLLCYEAGWDNISMFDGGWYEWDMDDSLPVQTGDPRE